MSWVSSELLLGPLHSTVHQPLLGARLWESVSQATWSLHSVALMHENAGRGAGWYDGKTWQPHLTWGGTVVAAAVREDFFQEVTLSLRFAE